MFEDPENAILREKQIKGGSRSKKIEEHRIVEEPFYLEQKNELTIGLAAYRNGIPLLLKGPTGSGKTRFMQFLAWKLGRPLITVSCHDDLSTSDLVGRYLIRGGDTFWMDGPMTLAVRHDHVGEVKE